MIQHLRPVVIIMWNLWGIRRSDPFGSVRVEDLRKAEALARCRMETLQADIEEGEEQIKNLLCEGASVDDDFRKNLYVMKIQALVESRRALIMAWRSLARDLQLFSNLIDLKNQEKRAARTGVWRALQKLSPDDLEQWYVKRAASDASRRELIEEMISITSGHFAGLQTPTVDETEVRVIMEEIRKKGLSTDGAAKRLVQEARMETEPIKRIIIQCDDLLNVERRDER